jgi:threonine dehydratase
MAFLFSRMKLVVEPGGAAAAAALLAGKVPAVAGRRVGVVLSGGNVDPARFAELVTGIAP